MQDQYSHMVNFVHGWPMDMVSSQESSVKLSARMHSCALSILHPNANLACAGGLLARHMLCKDAMTLQTGSVL